MDILEKIDGYVSKIDEGCMFDGSGKKKKKKGLGEEEIIDMSTGDEEVLTEAERTFSAIMKEILQLEKAINSGMMDKKSINLVRRQIDKLNDRLLQMEEDLAGN